MVKFLKSGKVVIITRGRHAGHKAVIIKAIDEPTKTRPYPHVIVAGVGKAPAAIRKNATRREAWKQSRVGSFLKVVNQAHLMPTRYSLENFDVSKVVTSESVADKAQKVAANKKVKTVFQKRHNQGQNRWFFTRLQF